MLNLVHLTDAAHKKAGQYSLGMKQRLGIALALLSDPKLLILDEPTNGLDPNGIIEIRELLITLVKEHQKTVFISSHLLAEIERMATHVGIINHGE
jgi:ABC-2 type transport system ATP-binding protein